jgi:hypothetical protein
VRNWWWHLVNLGWTVALTGGLIGALILSFAPPQQPTTSRAPAPPAVQQAAICDPAGADLTQNVCRMPLEQVDLAQAPVLVWATDWNGTDPSEGVNYVQITTPGIAGATAVLGSVDLGSVVGSLPPGRARVDLNALLTVANTHLTCGQPATVALFRAADADPLGAAQPVRPVESVTFTSNC